MGSEREAIARVAFLRRQSIAPVLWQTTLTICARCVVNAAQTRLNVWLRVAVADRVLVDVVIADTPLAGWHGKSWQRRTCRTEVAVVAELAQVALRAEGTFQADHFQTLELKVEEFGACAIVRAWTLLAHIGRFVVTDFGVGIFGKLFQLEFRWISWGCVYL